MIDPMRGVWLVVMVAAGCGRFGFDPGRGDGGAPGDAIGPPTADADPSRVYAGTCAASATAAVNPAAVAVLTSTVDGVVAGGDYGDLRSFRFVDGELAPVAATTVDFVDSLGTDVTGGSVLVLDEATGEVRYSVVDRALVGPAEQVIAGMRLVSPRGIARAGAGFAVFGLATDSNWTPTFTIVGSGTLVPVSTGFGTAWPAMAKLPDGFLAVATVAGACQWRWLDDAGALTGESIDDPAECAYPGVWVDANGATAIVTWTASTDAFARIRDLATHQWLTPAISLGYSRDTVDAFAIAGDWYVARLSDTAVDVLLVGPDGTVAGPILTGGGSGTPMVARILAIAGRPYLAWIMASQTMTELIRTLHVQPICGTA